MTLETRNDRSATVRLDDGHNGRALGALLHDAGLLARCLGTLEVNTVYLFLACPVLLLAGLLAVMGRILWRDARLYLAERRTERSAQHRYLVAQQFVDLRTLTITRGVFQREAGTASRQEKSLSATQ